MRLRAIEQIVAKTAAVVQSGLTNYAHAYRHGLRISSAPAESGDESLGEPKNGETFNGVHIAFNAPNRKVVDAFYAKAMRLGARDADPPGTRPQYSDNYYGAFVLDLDGNKLEAVTGND